MLALNGLKYDSAGVVDVITPAYDGKILCIGMNVEDSTK